jgi:DNA-binding response OmpR family regulator
MKPIRILIVDDDARFLTFLSRTLKRAGFEVVTASDGCEVPELIARVAVDVLVLDLQMPGMNGFEVLRSLREALPTQLRGGGQRPKVIVVSGRDEEDTSDFARHLGADAYLTKPLAGVQLVSAVRGVLVH